VLSVEKRVAYALRVERTMNIVAAVVESAFLPPALLQRHHDPSCRGARRAPLQVLAEIKGDRRRKRIVFSVPWCLCGEYLSVSWW